MNPLEAIASDANDSRALYKLLSKVRLPFLRMKQIGCQLMLRHPAVGRLHAELRRALAKRAHDPTAKVRCEELWPSRIKVNTDAVLSKIYHGANTAVFRQRRDLLLTNPTFSFFKQDQAIPLSFLAEQEDLMVELARMGFVARAEEA